MSTKDDRIPVEDVARDLRRLAAELRHRHKEERAHERTWSVRLRFVRAMVENGGNVRSAAKAAGRSHTTLYRQRMTSRAFDRLWSWAESVSESRSSWNEIWPDRVPADLVQCLVDAGVSLGEAESGNRGKPEGTA